MREDCATFARVCRIVAAVSVAAVLPVDLRAQGASGTIAYAGKKAGPVVVAPQHAYLVAGPDEVSGKPIRRVVLSVADVGSKICDCEAMSCADGAIGDGVT